MSVRDGTPRGRRLAGVTAAPGLAALGHVEAAPSGDGRWLLRLEMAGVSRSADLPEVKAGQVRITPIGDVPMRAVAVRGSPDGGALLVDAVRSTGPVDAGTAESSGVYFLSLAGVKGIDPRHDEAVFTLGDPNALPAEPGDGPADTRALPEGVRIDYLAKDYDSFRTLILDYLAAAAPRWRERSAADLGVALVEILAYAGDSLSYFQDASATEAYLGTARLRSSLRRHARLLDYRPSDGCNAATWMQITVSSDGLTLPAGTTLLTRIPGAPPVVGAGSAAHQQGLREGQVFETLEPILPLAEHGDIGLYAWGSADFSLPVGATSATLVDGDGSGRVLSLEAGDVLILEETRSATTGRTEDADPTHRHAVRLVSVSPGTDPAGMDGQPVNVLEVEWFDADALPFSLRVSGYAQGQPYADGARALGNVVAADHGRTVAMGARLPPVPSSGTLDLPATARPLTRAVAYLPRAERTRPAAALLDRDGASALPRVVVSEASGDAWHPVHDLLGSGPFSRDMVVEIDDDESAHLRFGDGQQGRRPHPGAQLEARWRIGYGPSGNVGPDVIGHVVGGADFAGLAAAITGVRNPIGASGGTPPEPATRIRTIAPQAYRTQKRCITVDDWTASALEAPEVLHATAEVGWAGTWPVARVTVQREGGGDVDDDYSARVRAVLEPLRPAGHTLVIRGPVWAPLDIQLRVWLEPRRFRRAVEAQLAQVLGDGTLPDGWPAFFHPDRWTFGEPVYLGPVIATALAVAGVTDVQADRFRRAGDPSPAAVTDPIDVGTREVARASTSGGASQGRVRFELVGGT